MYVCHRQGNGSTSTSTQCYGTVPRLRDTLAGKIIQGTRPRHHLTISLERPLRIGEMMQSAAKIRPRPRWLAGWRLPE